MASLQLKPSSTDPTPIFEHFRGAHATELLTAAVYHLGVFERLAQAGDTGIAEAELNQSLKLADRPAAVLWTALRAMGLIAGAPGGTLSATPLATEHLMGAAELSIAGYIGLAADHPGVLALVERLRTDQPAEAQADEGAAFIYRDGMESAMEAEASARRLTLALAGRARNVAPHLAANAPLEGAQRLVDVAGGTGIYAIACLQRHPELRATVMDRPEVLKVAHEFGERYGVADRLDLEAGDMFADPIPEGDAVLLSNVLHDWSIDTCTTLLARCAQAVRPGGRVLIHDVFLNDALDGPLPIALYSVALFTITEGRAYSAREYRDMLDAAELDADPEVIPTAVHCGVLGATRTTRGKP